MRLDDLKIRIAPWMYIYKSEIVEVITCLHVAVLIFFIIRQFENTQHDNGGHKRNYRRADKWLDQ